MLMNLKDIKNKVLDGGEVSRQVLNFLRLILILMNYVMLLTRLQSVFVAERLIPARL